MHRFRVGVVRGGPSSEYDVSLNTGASILQHIDREKYNPVDVLIDKRGLWHIGGLPISEERALRQVDVVVNAMHGEYGEDGTVQRLFEQFRVPHTGSGSLASAIAFNKGLTKHALRNAGVKMAPHRMLGVEDDLDRTLINIFRTLPQPSVIKPIAAGSSVGVTIAHNFDEFTIGVHHAFEISPKVMVEEFIKGREATVGVVDDFRGEKLYALFPIEIIPPVHKKFFDYEAKYGGETEEICPGNFSAAEKDELQRLAKLVHETIGLSHYSRSDFIVSRRGIYFLEVNTLPGMTNESLVPKAVRAAGSSLAHFIDHLIQLALKRK